MFLEKCLGGIGVFSELVLWSLVNLVFIFAERHKMIKVCGEGRGVETSMKLEVWAKRGRRAFVIVILTVGSFQVEVEIPGKSGKKVYDARYSDSERVFSALTQSLGLRSKDSAQMAEQITQFVNRHVGPCFVSNEM